MHNYKLMEDNETLLVNTCFFDEEDCEYAFKHRFNIKYTDVRNTGFAEDTMMLQKLGYKFELKIEPAVAPDGTKLDDKIYAYYTHPDNLPEDISSDERIIITEILNYLICLSRLVLPEQAMRHFGFNYDAANVDLFVDIKNKFHCGNLNINVILNNEIYKRMIKELDNMEDKING